MRKYFVATLSLFMAIFIVACGSSKDNLVGKWSGSLKNWSGKNELITMDIVKSSDMLVIESSNFLQKGTVLIANTNTPNVYSIPVGQSTMTLTYFKNENKITFNTQLFEPFDMHKVN